jgi:hypothetical protein
LSDSLRKVDALVAGVGIGKRHGVDSTQVIDYAIRRMSTNRCCHGFSVQNRVQACRNSEAKFVLYHLVKNIEERSK